MYNEIIEPDKVLLEIPINKGAVFVMSLLVGLHMILVVVWVVSIAWGIRTVDEFRGVPMSFWCLMPIFSFYSLLLVVHLFSPPTGIIFSADGFYDYSSVAHVRGLVAWKDVTLITTKRFNLPANFLLVRLNNPKEYIARENNPLRRLSQWGNYFLMGTPIIISPLFFGIHLKELKRTMTEQYENNRERVSATDNTDIPFPVGNSVGF